MRFIKFMRYPDFMKRMYLINNVTSVRVSTLPLSNKTIINGSVDYQTLMSRIKECLPDLEKHNMFDLTIWGLVKNQVISISKEYSNPYEPSVQWVDITNMMFRMAEGMEVVAFQVTFPNTHPMHRRSLFIVT